MQVLRSGSVCNSTVIGDILIDCGLNPKAVMRLTGIFPKAVLLTHEHSDHSRLVSDWLRICPVYSTYGTFDALKKLKSKNIRIVVSGYEYEVGNYTVEVHDAAHEYAVEPVYFVLKSASERILFSTDNHRIEQAHRRFTTVALEANYDEDIFNSKVLPDHLMRATMTHCSFQQALKILETLDLSRCEEIILLHLSDRFAEPAKFKAECEKKFGIPTAIGGR